MDIFYTNVLNTGPAGPTGPQGPSGTSNVHAAVNAATIQALSGVWSYTVGTTGGDGGNGVGATLTSTTAGIPGIDAVNLTTGMRVLVKDQADLKQNGVYYVTRGAAGQTPIWTRATDYDNSTVGQVAQGDQILVLAGTQNANKVYFETVTGTAAASSIKIGTDNIVFAQSSNLSNVNTDIIPAVDNFYNLGSQTFRWKSINVGPGTINITDDVLLTNAAIQVSNGVFFINGVAQAQLPNVKITNLTFNDNTVQTTAPGVPVSYNPTWSGTGLTFTGTPATGSYMKVGKLVTFRFKVLCTTVTNFGSGQYSITLPFNVATNYQFQNGAIHRNSSGSHYPLKAQIDSGNVMTLWDGSGATDAIFDHNSPYTLTTSDYFYLTGTYEVA